MTIERRKWGQDPNQFLEDEPGDPIEEFGEQDPDEESEDFLHLLDDPDDIDLWEDE